MTFRVALVARLSGCMVVGLSLFGSGCSKDEKAGGDAPPPTATTPPPSATGSAKSASVCEPGGEVNDPVSADLFPKHTAGYCVDPKGETKAYGDKAKLTMDDVCTTGIDGECEIYKGFGMTRMVRFMYIDGSGGGGNVEVTLSAFKDMLGAYSMYSKRVVAQDPLDKKAPRVLLAKTQGAIGTGRAYVWRGVYFLELQYNNDKESPEALAKASAKVLTEIGKDIGDRLPGDLRKPRAVEALPDDFMIPNGVELLKQPFGVACGNGAVGYYKQVDRRHRILAFAGEGSPQTVEDCAKALAKRPGALPVRDFKEGTEATHVVLQATSEAPKVEFVFARKGDVLYGVGDEEYLLQGKTGDDLTKARYGKDASVQRLKDVITWANSRKPAGSATPDAGAAKASASASASGTGSAAPPANAPASATASAAPKK